MRPSSSARIACILSPGSGFYRFYQGRKNRPRKFRRSARDSIAVQFTAKRNNGRRRKLMQAAHLVDGPIAENRLAVDEILAYRTEVAAVVRHGAVVAQNVV